jgi:hypothetical protein
MMPAAGKAASKTKHKLQKMRQLQKVAAAHGTAAGATVIVDEDDLEDPDLEEPDHALQDASGADDVGRVLSQYYASGSKAAAGQGQAGRLKPSRLNNSSALQGGAAGPVGPAGEQPQPQPQPQPQLQQRGADPGAEREQTVRFSEAAGKASGAAGHGAAAKAGAGREPGSPPGCGRAASAKARQGAGGDAGWVPIWERTNYGLSSREAAGPGAAPLSLQRQESMTRAEGGGRVMQALQVRVVDPFSFGLPGPNGELPGRAAGGAQLGAATSPTAAASGGSRRGGQPWSPGAGGGRATAGSGSSSWATRVVASAIRQAAAGSGR